MTFLTRSHIAVKTLREQYRRLNPKFALIYLIKFGKTLNISKRLRNLLRIYYYFYITKLKLILN